MNPHDSQDPLAQLQDIHLPPTIGLWPPAWGWWLLLIAVVAGSAALFFLLRRHRLRNGYRQLALQELQAIQRRYSSEQTSEYLQAISILLRRTAISGFASQFDTSIKGEAWLEWLDQQLNNPGVRFTSEAGRALLLGPYQKRPTVDREQLHQITAAWIQGHRNQWQKKAKAKTSAATAQQQEAGHHV